MYLLPFVTFDTKAQVLKDNAFESHVQWKDDDDAAAFSRPDRAAVYDMVHLVFTREKLLTDWGHPCCNRDRWVEEAQLYLQGVGRTTDTI